MIKLFVQIFLIAIQEGLFAKRFVLCFTLLLGGLFELAVEDPLKLETFENVAPSANFKLDAIRDLLFIVSGPRSTDLLDYAYGLDLKRVCVHHVCDPCLCVANEHPRTYIIIDIQLVILRFLGLKHNSLLWNVVVI